MEQAELVPVPRATMDGGNALEAALVIPALRTWRREALWAC